MPLRELSVEDLAVVESVRLTLAPGFTVLTGETGAGKSLVVDAIGLALGARASTELVRAGSQGARVEAIFDAVPSDPDDPLDELVAAEGGVAIVRREIGADGRSVARVNDRAVTVGGLAGLGMRLGEIHGQHEQQRLLEPARQLALLDGYGGLAAERAAVGEAYRAWRSTVAAAAELVTDSHELARRVELLRHQVDEITGARLRPGEEDELAAQVRAADHAEAILRSAARATDVLREEGGAVEGLAAADAALGEAAEHDERFGTLRERAAGLSAEATELARDVADAARDVELDPAARAVAEERLTLLYDLRRKYGDTIEAVIAFGEAATSELERLEGQEGERERLRDEQATLRETLEGAVAALSTARAEAAQRLSAAVNAELPPLGIPFGAFGIQLEPGEVSPSGGDRVTFTFAPNRGEPPRPLARIASGGEASRLSLALKVVLAAADETPLLVFDEIDAGVGGRNAAALGERLKALSGFHQVVCVTHLAQVASHADAHLVLGKRVEGRRTLTTVRQVSGDERTAELAAMLAGEGVGGEARATAEALLRAAAR
jgi:DNA repair protein RecN (Recombination protein N)